MVQIFKSLKKEVKKSNKTDFLSVIFHKWISSKNNFLYFISELDIKCNKEKHFLFT